VRIEITAAILDRLVNAAFHVPMPGRSYRATGWSGSGAVRNRPSSPSAAHRDRQIRPAVMTARSADRGSTAVRPAAPRLTARPTRPAGSPSGRDLISWTFPARVGCSVRPPAGPRKRSWPGSMSAVRTGRPESGWWRSIPAPPTGVHHRRSAPPLSRNRPGRRSARSNPARSALATLGR
jgi:hypothetical protein